MLTLLCFLTCFQTILMALVGVVGGVITSVILRTFNHPHFSARNLGAQAKYTLTRAPAARYHVHRKTERLVLRDVEQMSGRQGNGIQVAYKVP